MDENKSNNKLHTAIKYYGIIGTAVGKTLMFLLWYAVAMSIITRNLSVPLGAIKVYNAFAWMGATGTYVFEYMVGRKRLEE